MDDATFEQHKVALISKVLEKETRLTDRSGRYWQEIDRANFDFNTRDRLTKRITAINKSELVEAYRKVFLSSQQRRLTLVAVGNGQQVDTQTPYQTIEGITEYKQR